MLAAAGQSKRPVRDPEPAVEVGGRYWDRISDLLGVNYRSLIIRVTFAAAFRVTHLG
jgi:hypothetical protein